VEDEGFEKIRGLEWVIGVEKGYPEDHGGIGEVGEQKEKNAIENVEVVFLWLHFLLKLELNRFFGQILIFSMGRKWMWVMIIDEIKIQVLDNYKGRLWRNTSMQIFLQWRLYLNTSKQVSTKETTLKNVYKYSKKIFFFWNGVSTVNRG